MKKLILMVTAICDKCGKDLCDKEDYSCVSEDWLPQLMEDADWETIDEKHYCDDCWEIDENDNIVVKISQNKPCR